MNLSSTATDSGTHNVNLTGLLDDPKQLVRLRILRAARILIAERGLSVSMEAIAESAGMGRRTMFRYFTTREELVAAALTSALDWYDEQIDTATRSDLTLNLWLTELIGHLHQVHRSAGRGIWQLAASDDSDLPPQFARVNERRRSERRRTTKAIADAAWRRSGAPGECPPIVVEACALTISSFATHSMIDDYGSQPGSVAVCTATLLENLIRTEAESRRKQAPKSPNRSRKPTS